METTRIFTTATQLQDTIEAACRQTSVTKIRIFEFDKSYEDYSITYTLSKMPIANFIVNSDEDSIILTKKGKKSTRHIKFAKGATCIVEYVKKHVPYLAIKIQADVFYTDGTHRYRK